MVRLGNVSYLRRLVLKIVQEIGLSEVLDIQIVGLGLGQDCPCVFHKSLHFMFATLIVRNFELWQDRPRWLLPFRLLLLVQFLFSSDKEIAFCLRLGSFTLTRRWRELIFKIILIVIQRHRLTSDDVRICPVIHVRLNDLHKAFALTVVYHILEQVWL